MRKLIIRSCNVVLCCAVYIQSLQLVQMGGLRLASPVGTTLAAEVGPERRSLDNSEKERQEQEWGTFRLAFPYHFQTIAISNRYGDGTRTLIVSEPPPHCEAARIEALLPDGSSAIEIKTHTVGHDGWVKDLVTTLPRSMTNEARTALVRKLSEYLFHTDYGAYFLPLPVAKRAVEKKYPLDLRVGVAELKQWVVDGNFHTADNTPAGKLANLLDTGGGLFFGKDWGLVVWVIPKGTDIDACRADMRRFALDSDLILGAVKVADKGVVIVGRERVVPITVLPPLRGETIALLAGAKTKELGQSYERTAPFAGKFRGPWDWAPSYLSPELIDTEYGSLLNIGDQLLKSWTQHGTVRYQNFPYPDPPRFPFDQALSQELDTGSLLFNWNTTGVGFTVDFGAVGVYGVNRTGALPVIYRPDDENNDGASVIHGDVAKVLEAEENGYDYFASLNNPVLARIVQYAALYQSFRAFGIEATPPARVETDAQKRVVLERVKSVLEEMAGSDEKKMRSVARQRAEEMAGLLADSKWNSGLDFVRAVLARDQLTAVIEERLIELIEPAWKQIRTFAASVGAPNLNYVGMIVAASRDTDFDELTREWNVSQATGEQIAKLAGVLRNNAMAITLWSEVDGVRQSFSKAHGTGTQKWIHTQSIVVSRGEGEFLTATGGTNLNSEVTRFTADDTIERGTIKRAPDGSWRIHPLDASRASELVRPAAVDKSKPNIQDLLTRRLSESETYAPADKSVALASGDRPVPLSRGFGGGHVPPPGEPPVKAATVGEPPDRMPLPGSNPTAALAIERKRYRDANGTFGEPPATENGEGLVKNGLLIEKRDGQVFLYRETDSGSVVAEVWDASDAHRGVVAELKAGGRRRDKMPLELSFGSGFERPGDVEAFVKSLSQYAERFPETRPTLVFRNLKPQAQARLSSRLQNVTTESVSVIDAPGGLRVVRAKLTAETAPATGFAVGIETRLKGNASEVSEETVNATLTATAHRATADEFNVKELGAAIYMDLQQLTPGRRAGRAVISVQDVGDFSIVLDDGGGDNRGAGQRLASVP